MITAEQFSEVAAAQVDTGVFLSENGIPDHLYAAYMSALVDQFKVQSLTQPLGLCLAVMVGMAFKQGWGLREAIDMDPDALKVERDHYFETLQSYGRVLQALVNRADGELELELGEIDLEQSAMIVVEVDGEIVRVVLQEVVVPGGSEG